MADAGEKEAPLEKDLERLEAIVAKLESGEVALEKSIALYEEGRRLGTRCLERLSRLEQRVQVVREGAGGALRAEPFGEEPDGGSDVADA